MCSELWVNALSSAASSWVAPLDAPSNNREPCALLPACAHAPARRSPRSNLQPITGGNRTFSESPTPAGPLPAAAGSMASERGKIPQTVLI